MNRWCKHGLLAVAVLLFVLLVWQIAQRCAPSNPFHADPSQLEAVELRYIDLFFGKSDVAVSLTDPASIRAFCSIWNADYVTEIHPYDAHGYTGLVEMPSGSSDGLRICLMYRDGRRRYFSLTEEYLFDRGTDNTRELACYFHTGVVLADYVEAQLAQAK